MPRALRVRTECLDERLESVWRGEGDVRVEVRKEEGVNVFGERE